MGLFFFLFSRAQISGNQTMCLPNCIAKIKLQKISSVTSFVYMIKELVRITSTLVSLDNYFSSYFYGINMPFQCYIVLVLISLSNVLTYYIDERS